MVSQKPKYCNNKNFERNSHWRKLSMIMVWERFSKTRILFIFFVYIFIHISANMSPFGLKFSQMILHTETSKLMYNRSFLFEVLHKPTLLPSTFKSEWSTDKTIGLLNSSRALCRATFSVQARACAQGWTNKHVHNDQLVSFNSFLRKLYVTAQSL